MDPKARILARRARLIAVALASCAGPPTRSVSIEVPAASRAAPTPSATPDPIVDSDGDGVPDADDRCPDLAGPDRGCPARPCLSIVQRIAIFERVAFAANATTPAPAARPVLEVVAKVLAERPELRVRVEGHTDSTEPEALGPARAIAVRAALAKLGVDASRLEVIGRGSASPRATNATAAGREENRRVEFVVLP